MPIVWDEQHIGKEVDPRTNSFVTRENLDSVLVRPFRHRRRRQVPHCQLRTPMGGGGPGRTTTARRKGCPGGGGGRGAHAG